MLLHLFALLVAGATAILIFVGGLVTSTGSGLSVPDWPTTYGWFMLTFPFEKMVGGILYEHSHRLIASAVGFLIIIQAAWLWSTEPRAWVRRLGYGALGAVIAQGILGGITVLWFLPNPISIAHAGLAQLVFCFAVSIALVTSPGWKHGYAWAARPAPQVRREPDAGSTSPAPPTQDTTSVGAGVSDRALQRLGVVTTVVIYAQILVGATIRHTGAGLAIPDFPLAFGRLVPSSWNAQIAVHYAHRVGALLVLIMVLATAWLVFSRHRRRSELARPSALLIALVALQITLGAFTVLSGKQFIINSLHVVVGGMVLATSLVLALRAHRGSFAAGIGNQGSGIRSLPIPDPRSPKGAPA